MHATRTPSLRERRSVCRGFFVGTRHDEEWLGDILDAITAIDGYLAIDGLQQGLIYDACRVRLMEIGEAVKHLDPALLEREPTVAWKEIARMRDVLVHHYHDTDFAIVEAVVTERLAPLREAVLRLRELNTRS